MNKLPGDYIAGFVDGEGCFALKFRRDVRHERKNQPAYFYWSAEFAILLRSDDKDILEKIKETLQCGFISNNRNKAFLRYAVQNIPDLKNKIIPFFDKHRLYAKKAQDFQLWKEAIDILMQNRQVNMERKENQKGFSKINWRQRDLEKLMEIQKTMQKYKSGHRPWKWLAQFK